MNKYSYLKLFAILLSLYTVDNLTCLSHSQSFEDLILFKVCFQHLKHTGVYLEVGALDGIKYSNSYYYESCFNWTGILIEPSPSSFAILQQKRPDNLLLNVAGCKEAKKVMFTDAKFKELSGRTDLMTQNFKDKWGKYMKTMVEIDCVPLTPLILSKFNHINFFSLDVEGAELELLESVDFNQIKVDIIIVEASDLNEKNLAVEQYLINRHYSPYGCLIPRSILFIHENVDYCIGLARNKTTLIKHLGQDLSKCKYHI